VSVHELLEREARGDRRKAERLPYVCTQLVAPTDGVKLPSPGDFLPIRCRDLSTRGMSFVWPVRPRFLHAVAALGRSSLIVVMCRIVHVTWEDDEYLCGCRFLRRIRGDLGLVPAADSRD
jgi:hypothetical protein